MHERPAKLGANHYGTPYFSSVTIVARQQPGTTPVLEDHNGLWLVGLLINDPFRS